MKESNEQTSGFRSIRDMNLSDEFIDEMNQKDTEEEMLEPEDPSRGGIPPETFYYTVYPVLAERLHLSRIELNLLCAIRALQQNTGWCYAAQASLAYWTQISVQTLNVTLRQLESRGLLERDKAKSYLATVQWKLGTEAQELVEYILEQINKRALEKGGFKRRTKST